MMTFSRSLAALCTLALMQAPLIHAQETKAGEAKEPAKSSTPSQEELEAKFKETMTNATMAGRWCSIENGALGPDKEDKYSIVSVAKTGGDDWTISARIQFGDKEFVAPIPVKVKWAGDTAIIVVNKLPFPGSGVYSARVLVYDNTYAGTWTGGDHGGLLNGIISKAK